MKKETKDLRLNPQDRIVPKFDEESIALFPVAEKDKMGFRVLDNCAEEHIMQGAILRPFFFDIWIFDAIIKEKGKEESL